MEVIKAVGVRWLCFPEGVPPTLKSLRLGKLPSLKDLMFIQSLSITFLMDFINHINWGNLEPLYSFELPPYKSRRRVEKVLLLLVFLNVRTAHRLFIHVLYVCQHTSWKASGC
jgi:hypothetical protein